MLTLNTTRLEDNGESAMNNKKIDISKKTVLITGVAGFIGSFLAKGLLEKCDTTNIIGIDNLNTYYDVELKKARISSIQELSKKNTSSKFQFLQGSIENDSFINRVFEEYKPTVVINLAAQAGVRYSITNPDDYIKTNIVGFFNILEACRHSYDGKNKGVQHLVYASSSSVYGANKKVPYSTGDRVDNPISLYAATKKSNELMAYSYSKLYGIPCTGLRFFTVYGPMGRPDMAYFKFTQKMVKGEKIQIYNHGDMYRDFTYIDDIIKGIISIYQNPPSSDENGASYKIYNIGNNKPESLMHFVNTLESSLLNAGIITNVAQKEFLPMQPGDVYQTYADVDDLIKDFDFKPSTPLEEGLAQFAAWYKDYYI